MAAVAAGAGVVADPAARLPLLPFSGELELAPPGVGTSKCGDGCGICVELPGAIVAVCSLLSIVIDIVSMPVEGGTPYDGLNSMPVASGGLAMMNQQQLYSCSGTSLPPSSLLPSPVIA